MKNKLVSGRLSNKIPASQYQIYGRMFLSLIIKSQQIITVI